MYEHIGKYYNRIFEGGATTSNNNCTATCSSSSCATEASFYLANMNQTVDPCEDFYEFVCGNFIQNATIPEDYFGMDMIYLAEKKLTSDLINEMKTEIKDSDIKAVKNAKLYFQNCMDETSIEKEGIDPFLKILNKLGGWPVINNEWKEDTYDWKETVQKISELGLKPRFPFKIAIFEDSTDSTKYNIKIGSALRYVSETYFAKDSKNFDAYKSYMIGVAELLGANRSIAEKDLAECLNFEIELYKISTPLEQLYDISPVENTATVKNISEKYPSIPWIDILNKIINPSSVFINETEVVEIEDPKFTSAIGQLIDSTPKKVLANYQIWHAIEALVKTMPKEFHDKKITFKKTTLGISKKPAREKTCMNNVYKSLPIAVSAMFIRKFSNRKIKATVEEIVQHIQNQTKLKIKNVNWMDEQTRSSAIQKLDAMGARVAFPDELLDDTKVEEYYKMLVVDSGSYVNNFLNIESFTKKCEFSKLREPLNEAAWASKASVAVINAFYYSGKNEILLPAGILRGIFFQIQRPQYLNYGSIGSIVGHEITHGFDNIGRKYDKNGNFVNWWQNSTEEKFNEKAKCFEDQFNNYTNSQVGLKLNGKLTLMENIADNGGLKLAYYAYQEWEKQHNGKVQCLPGINYTPHQMFWISAAATWCSKSTDQVIRTTILQDFHSPAEARVRAAFANVYEFANDFHCSLGSKMHPETKCNIW